MVRNKAKAVLKGHRHTTFGIQLLINTTQFLVIVAEYIFFLRLPNALTLFLIFALDLLLISPLKAGKHVYYYSLVTQNQSNFRRLFHFFGAEYQKSIAWRLRLWTRRLLYNSIFCIPCSFFLYFSQQAERYGNYTISLIALAFFVILMVFAFLITEILLLRYLPASYLLTTTDAAKQAFQITKQISKGNLQNFLHLYLSFVGWCFLFPLVVPFFYIEPLFQIQRAILMAELISKNSRLFCQQHLKRLRNHGKIMNDF